MHILTITSSISMGTLGMIVPGRYYVEDIPAAELLVMARPCTAFLITCPLGNTFSEINDYNGKRVLFMRNGGFGDMLFLTPILRELRRRWPGVQLYVACRAPRHAIFDGLTYAVTRIETPVSVDIFSSFDCVVSFEYVIETERKLHYVDALAAHMGLTIPSGVDARRCDYAVLKHEILWAQKTWPWEKQGAQRAPRLGIQVRSGVRCRTYPMAKLCEVAGHLATLGWEIGLLGNDGDARGPVETGVMRNWTAAGLTFRQSCALMHTCDVVLGPDSALLHVAGALGIPAVGLFGPIPKELRLYPETAATSLQGRGKCAPCFFHARGGIQFPENCPTRERGVCGVLESIDPVQVVGEIVKAWRAKK